MYNLKCLHCKLLIYQLKLSYKMDAKISQIFTIDSLYLR